jgi:hypothetical protein
MSLSPDAVIAIKHDQIARRSMTVNEMADCRHIGFSAFAGETSELLCTNLPPFRPGRMPAIERELSDRFAS